MVLVKSAAKNIWPNIFGISATAYDFGERNKNII